MPIKYQCYIDLFNFLVVKIQINDHKNELVGQVKKKTKIFTIKEFETINPNMGNEYQPKIHIIHIPCG